MAKAMKKDGVYLFISKPYSVVEWTKFTEENRDLMDKIVLCRSELESQGLFFLLDNVPEIRRVYLTSKNTVLSVNFKKFVKRVKAKYPSYAVMVGKEENPPRVLLEANPEVQNVWLWSLYNKHYQISGVSLTFLQTIKFMYDKWPFYDHF